MDTFSAIDFETANPQRVSACALGYAIVRDGAIAETGHHLINPVGGHADICTRAHGITEQHTRLQPDFAQLYKTTLQPLLSLPIIAYGTFDKQVLIALAQHFNLSIPFDNYTDVCRIAQRGIDIAHNHRLPTIAQHLGIKMESHHNARSDAIACAEVYLRIKDIGMGTPEAEEADIRANSFADAPSYATFSQDEIMEALDMMGSIKRTPKRGFVKLCETLFAIMNQAGDDDEASIKLQWSFHAKTHLPAHFKNRPRDESIDWASTVPPEWRVPEGWAPIIPELPKMTIAELWEYRRNNPLENVSGAKICITGDLAIDRDIVSEIVTQHGGTLQNSVTRETDFLVVGGLYGSEFKSGKQTKAEANISKGAHTRIIDEAAFWPLMAAARTFGQPAASIRFSCPGCGCTIETESSMSGVSAECPNCAHPVAVL